MALAFSSPRARVLAPPLGGIWGHDARGLLPGDHFAGAHPFPENLCWTNNNGAARGGVSGEAKNDGIGAGRSGGVAAAGAAGLQPWHAKALGEVNGVHGAAIAGRASGGGGGSGCETASSGASTAGGGLFMKPLEVLQAMVPYEYPKIRSKLSASDSVLRQDADDADGERVSPEEGSPAASLSDGDGDGLSPVAAEMNCDAASTTVDSTEASGGCGMGLALPPGMEPCAKQHSLYKTELCRSWEETGTCRYGNKCQFAHGISELRDVPRHPKYKTEICCTFATTGTCPYGRRCRFIHQNGPITAVGTKRPQVETKRPPPERKGSDMQLKLAQFNPRCPVSRQVSDPKGAASRRLPVFVELSMSNANGIIKDMRPGEARK